MGDERTEPRERWLIMVWKTDAWELAEQWSQASASTARSRASGLQQSQGRQNVRLIHTADSAG